jgi:hypothetical protein
LDHYKRTPSTLESCSVFQQQRATILPWRFSARMLLGDEELIELVAQPYPRDSDVT